MYDARRAVEFLAIICNDTRNRPDVNYATQKTRDIVLPYQGSRLAAIPRGGFT
jgi:hypothetical protein